MNARVRRYLAIVSLGAVAWAIGAEATPKVQKTFTTRYPATSSSKLVKCTTCHEVRPPALNSYGKDLKAAHGNLATIEKLDSDKDGFSNLAEIKALTLPGDPKDKPPAVPADSSGKSRPDSAATDTSAQASPDSGSKEKPKH